jgi:hypothetical protein
MAWVLAELVEAGIDMLKSRSPSATAAEELRHCPSRLLLQVSTVQPKDNWAFSALAS